MGDPAPPGPDRLLAAAAVEAADTVPMASFPLGWRWTSPRHAALDPARLARIVPLRPARARAVEALWRARWPEDQLFPLRPDPGDGASFPTGLLADEAVRDWLRARLPSGRAPVFVSWGPDQAALTDSELFAEHWSNFCYPASDDAVICPPDAAWALGWYHEEVFRFVPAGPAGR